MSRSEVLACNDTILPCKGSKEHVTLESPVRVSLSNPADEVSISRGALSEALDAECFEKRAGQLFAEAIGRSVC